MDWKKTLGVIAPTVATALGGPLAGGVVAFLGDLLGISEPTQEKIATAFQNGQLTGDQIAAIKVKEMELQAEEKERGFRYAELEFKDRDSARRASVDGGTLSKLFWLSLVLLLVTLGTEIAVLFIGTPAVVPNIVVGRVLGLMDAVAMMVLAFWYGTSSGSARKTELLAVSPPVASEDSK